MHRVLASLAATVVAAGSFVIVARASAAKASSMLTPKGCVIGKQKWDASDSKCIGRVRVRKAAITVSVGRQENHVTASRPLQIDPADRSIVSQTQSRFQVDRHG